MNFDTEIEIEKTGGGIKGMMGQAGSKVALSYIFISLLLLSCVYYYGGRVNSIGGSWLCVSSSVALLIFASSQVPSLLQPAAMACGMTLFLSSIICCSTSCMSGFKPKR